MFLFGNCHLNVVEVKNHNKLKNNATCAKKRIITYKVKKICLKKMEKISVDWHEKNDHFICASFRRILWHENLFRELIAIILVIEIKISSTLKCQLLWLFFFLCFENVCCSVLASFIVNKIISERVSIIFLLIDLIVQFENI